MYPPHLRNPPVMPNLGGSGGVGGGGVGGNGGAGTGVGAAGGGGIPVIQAGGGVPLPDGSTSEFSVDSIKTKEDLVKAIAAGHTIPFDITLKVLEGHFAKDLKGKLERGEQLGVENEAGADDEKMNE